MTYAFTGKQMSEMYTVIKKLICLKTAEAGIYALNVLKHFTKILIKDALWFDENNILVKTQQ